MQQSLLSGNAQRRVALQHLVEQVQAELVEGHLVAQGLRFVLLLLALGEQRKLLDAGPLILGRGASDLENLLKLLLLVITSEEGFMVHNFSENASNGPNIHRGAVVLAAHQDVGRTVPQCHDLVSEIFDGNSEGSRKAEVSQF